MRDAAVRPNGNGVRSFALAVLTGIVISFGTFTLKDIGDQVRSIDREIRPRLTAIETQLVTIDARLQRIERALDQVSR